MLPKGEFEFAEDIEQLDSWGLASLFLVLFLSTCTTYVLLRTRFRFLPESILVIVIGIIFFFLNYL